MNQGSRPSVRDWELGPVRWLNRHALVQLPARIDQSNAEPVRQQLQALTTRGLLVLIVDMSRTTDCDHTGSEALTRVYQRAMITGTDLRLVVPVGPVPPAIRMTGLDRVIPVHHSVASAITTTVPADVPQPLAGAFTTGPAQPPWAAGYDAGTEVAVLDRDGVIVWVNQAWQAFAAANGGDPDRTGVGVRYLDICAVALDDPVARQVEETVRRALAGDLPGALTVEVPCHSPDTARWFDMLISPRRDDSGQSLGATVTLSLTRTQTRSLLPNGSGDGSLLPSGSLPTNGSADGSSPPNGPADGSSPPNGPADGSLLPAGPGEVPDRLSEVRRLLEDTARQAVTPIAEPLEQAITELAAITGELRARGPGSGPGPGTGPGPGPGPGTGPGSGPGPGHGPGPGPGLDFGDRGRSSPDPRNRG